MVNLYEVGPGGLAAVEHTENKAFLIIEAPTHNELQRVSQEFNLPIDLLTAALDPDERPRVEFDEGAMLILARYPIQAENEDELPYFTHPLGIIIAHNLVVALSTREAPFLMDFVEARIKNFNPDNRPRFVLQVLNRINFRFLRFLKDLDIRAGETERELRTSTNNSDILRLMNVEKCLVYFNTSLRSNYLMLQRLDKTNLMRNLGEDEQDLFEDLLIDNSQAIEMTKIYTNIVKTQMDAFSSIINNNLNNVINRLTKITVIIAAPNLVASIYGMNVLLPAQEDPMAFWYIMATSLGVVGWIYFFFLEPRR